MARKADDLDLPIRLDYGSMRASLLAISKYAPAGISSNYITGLKIGIAGFPAQCTKAQDLRTGPEQRPELCPSHQIGSTPENLRILHLYTQERIASDSSAFSEPEQVSCLGLRG
jgi:hypothetical protein